MKPEIRKGRDGKMDVSGPSGAYTAALLEKCKQTQGQVLMRLMNVAQQSVSAQSKPLGNLSPHKVDVMA